MGDNTKYEVAEFHNNIASGYDEVVNASIPAQFIRNYFRQRILSNINPGQHLLEIGCGTGTDAVFLANKGIKITATDISPNMLKITAEKAKNEKLTDFIKTELLDADNLEAFDGNVFDGIISNLNAVNYVKDLNKFSLNTFKILKPGAKVFFVMLNKVCLWEIIYNLLKLKPVTAFERLISREKYYKTQMHLYLPGKIKKIFSKYYKVNKITGFGFLYPPDGLSAFQKKHTAFFSKIPGLENFLCSKFPFYNLCDHYLIEMTRN
jgi:ubiquinone/menaquinone biosynthesis C-methylase UbiE